MAGSRTFGNRIPFKSHLNRGTGGVQAEITKLRQELDDAFFELETDAQLATYTISTVNPGVNDDSTQGHSRFSRWINTTLPFPREFVCLDAAPGAAYWQETTNLIGGGPVNSVYGRTGNVVAQFGDYSASLVSNDSATVPGASVADALDNIFAAIPPVAPVDSVFGRIGAVVAMAGDYTSTQITNSSTVPGLTVTGALDDLQANKVPNTRTLTAGNGLTGGGDLTADRTFSVLAHADGSIVSGVSGVQVGILATDAQHGQRGGGNLHIDATAVSSGFMSITDKVKLDGIEAGAEVNDVFSVFGRVGAVVAVLNDYSASLINNDSGVVGATVAAALNTLNAGKVPNTRQIIAGAGLTGGGDLSADRTLDVVAHADGSIVVNANDIQVGILATDAQHGNRGGGSLHALASGSAAGFMSAADFTKLAGVAANAAALTSTAPVDVTKAAAAVGVGTTAAKHDHKHDISTAAPTQGIGGGNSEGNATSLARSNHDHAIRETGGPTNMTVGAIADGQAVARSGTALVGFYPISQIFSGGASMGGADAGKHFEVDGGTGGNKNAALSSTYQQTAPFTGTIRALAWNSAAADGTTVFKININGAVVSTHTLSGVSGVLTITTAVTQGDLVAVEFDAGTAPGNTTVQLYASRTP